MNINQINGFRSKLLQSSPENQELKSSVKKTLIAKLNKSRRRGNGRTASLSVQASHQRDLLYTLHNISREAWTPKNDNSGQIHKDTP